MTTQAEARMNWSTVRLENRPDEVAILWLDVEGDSVNKLRPEMAQDLEAALEKATSDDEVQALVLASAKPESFVVGADINLLQEVETAEEGRQLSRSAQQAANRIALAELPTVAAIHGPCLGGGLELALACDERVASTADITELGFPEVQLGVIPGAGGTQRLPPLVGGECALKMILQSKRYNAERSSSIGLVQESVSEYVLLEVAIRRAKRLAQGSKPQRKNASPAKRIRGFFLEGTAIGRKLMFDQARERTLADTHGNYPAPLRAIDVIEISYEKGPKAGLEAEAEAFGELVVSEQARELIRLFFIREALKKDPGVDNQEVEHRSIRKVGVLGGGLMGSGIAYVTTAKAGHSVRLKEIDQAQAREALKSYRGILDNRVERRRMTPAERDELLLTFSTTAKYDGFGDVDLVLEAVFEDLEVKHQVLREMQQVAPPNFIFASNTSSIPIHRIAMPAERPENVVGMHYFSPVPRIPLLEVVRTEETAPEAVATAVELGKAQGKIVIVVRDGPGFYTSRILAPYINEAAKMVGEGVPVDRIDEALVKYGYPVGPLKLLDEVGVDVGYKISAILENAFGSRMAPPEGLERLAEEGRIGKKSGKGFYKYRPDGEGGWKSTGEVDPAMYDLLEIEPDHEMPMERISSRCVLAMVNEAGRCYQEGIVRSARDADAGAVFGLGFPPFLGGPLRFANNQGVESVLRDLRELQKAHGELFNPAPIFERLAEEGGQF